MSEKQKSKNIISLLIVEDQPLIQKRLRSLFDRNPDFDLLAVCTSAEEAIEKVKEKLPDMMLVDLELPGIKGDQLIAHLHEKFPQILVAVFTVFEEQERIYRLLKLGIKGYIMKETSDELLLAELKVIALGGATLTERIAQKIIDATAEERGELKQELSSREQEILNLISLGLKYKEIADDLNISPHTVRRHIENIYRKLEVNSKVEALGKANRLGILNF